jgi:hypothetical protein
MALPMPIYDVGYITNPASILAHLAPYLTLWTGAYHSMVTFHHATPHYPPHETLGSPWAIVNQHPPAHHEG